jgi:pyrroline-5-carboxylate reductase
MEHQRIAFIGCGNMARSLIGGLIADGYPPGKIVASDIDLDQLSRAEEHFGIPTDSDAQRAVSISQVIVFAVKPQQLGAVAKALAPALAGRPVLAISVAAGVRTDSLARWLGGDPAIVRVMPNTPALVNSGASALYANAQASPEQREFAEGILRAVGLTLWLEDEDLLDSVTALSGSGPAYFFYVMEAMESAGVTLGLSPEQARLLTIQTAFGAAKMALESSADPAQLRAQVTSPGGTTERALAVLEQGGMKMLFQQALAAARTRSQELAQSLGEPA